MLPEAIMPKWSIRRPLSELAAEEATEEATAVAAAAPPSTAATVPARSSECVVCLDEPRTHAFLECMHMCVCAGCAELLLAKDEWRGTVHAEGAECPLCRTNSISVRRVFG